VFSADLPESPVMTKTCKIIRQKQRLKGTESRPSSLRRFTQERSLEIRQLLPGEMKVSELKAPIGSRVVELTFRMVALVRTQVLANKTQGSRKNTTTQMVDPNRWRRLREFLWLRATRKFSQQKIRSEAQ
jgi:hypothetical protein